MQETTAWRSSIWSNTSATSVSDSASPRTTLAIIFSISTLQGTTLQLLHSRGLTGHLIENADSMHHGTTAFHPYLRVSDRCSMNTQLPMSTSFLVTNRAVPPPPATKMLALSGSICLLVLAWTTQLLLPRCCSLHSSQG